MDILGSAWSAAIDLRAVLVSILSLVVSPDLHSVPEHGANPEAEALFVRDREAYNTRVRELIKQQSGTKPADPQTKKRKR